MKTVVEQARHQSEIWEFYQDEQQAWRWLRSDAGGTVIGASARAYEKREDCQRNAERYGYNGHYDPSGSWEFYEDQAGAWRWRHVDRDGEIEGESPAGSVDKNECIASAFRHGYKAE